MGLFKLKKLKEVITEHAKNDPTLLSSITIKYGEAVTDKGEPIMWEGDTLTENMPVFTVDPVAGGEVPVPTGDYVLKTGETISVTDGVVTKIAAPAAASGAPAAAPSTPATPATAEQSTPKRQIERTEIESYFNQVFKPEVDALKAEVAKLKSEKEALEAEKTKLSEQVTKLGEQESGKPALKTVALNGDKPTPKTQAEIKAANLKRLQEAYK